MSFVNHFPRVYTVNALSLRGIGRSVGFSRSVEKETGSYGIAIRQPPRSESGFGERVEDPGAAEDTPLNRLRAGLGLQPSASPQRVEPTIAPPPEYVPAEAKRAVVDPPITQSG